ncbi:MAG TPA: hypothetical protein VLE02_02755 [Nitrosarchaeum sp.]|nr:hypothetical protein [Nitrosarchaeum sp.]
MTLEQAIQKYYQENDNNSVMDLDVFNDYTVVTGATGSGKTTMVEQEIIPKYDGIPLWILDVKRKFSNCGKVVHSLEELDKRFQYVYQPKDISQEMFGKFCLKLQSQHDIHAVIDEIHLWLSKQSIFRPHYDLIMTKRNDGVTHTSISTNTKAIPNYLLSNVTHIYSLRYNIRADIDWLSDYIGTKAEFLLTPDLRNPIDTGIYSEELKRNFTFKDLPQLKDYGFVYRDKKKLDSAILRGFKI